MKRVTRRRLTIKHTIYLTIASGFFFAFILPGIIGYIILPKDHVSFDVKEQIALAGKNYFNYETGKMVVSVRDLINKGYLPEIEGLDKKHCSFSESTVSLVKNDDKIQYYVDLYCDTHFSSLTLSN